MRHRLTYILLLILPVIGNALTCPQSCDTEGACKREFYIGSKKIQYYSNFSLNKNNNCINKVVFAIHGIERNAEGRYFAALDASKTMGKENTTLIISPLFKTIDDNPSKKDYFWSEDGWKKGNTSINNGPQISSFAVADEILDNINSSGLFPLLTQIAISGHSAGGQYTQLYALTTMNPDLNTNLFYQFVVLNPSNYSYLNELRPNPLTGFFEKPVYWTGDSWKMRPEYQEEAGDCPNTYNDYKYGLEDRNSYANQLPAEALISQFIQRKVYYFLGELDNNPDDSSLDKSCPAKLEGPHRLSRGQIFYDFLNLYFPSHQHSLQTVPEVGHDGTNMYDSPGVKTVLFNN